MNVAPLRNTTVALGPVVALALALITPLAHAEPSAADRAVAESLYEEGRTLFQAGRFPDACPKFEESQKLDPGVGTLLYLGSCYEKVGKLASAWITLREAATAARASNQPDREKKALDLAEALAPKISRLQILVPPEHDQAGLQIKRDGTPFGRALWGTAVPVDLGQHTVEVSAPSRRSVSLTVDVAQAGRTVTLQIPLLEPVSAPPAASTAPPPASTGVAPPPPPPATATAATALTPLRTAALAAGGVGLLGLGLGSFFGLRAIGQWDDSRPLCPADRCTGEGYDLAQSASRSGKYSTAFFALGVAGLGTGVALWLVAPSSTASGQRSPGLSVGLAGPGVFARGAW